MSSSPASLKSLALRACYNRFPTGIDLGMDPLYRDVLHGTELGDRVAALYDTTPTADGDHVFESAVRCMYAAASTSFSVFSLRELIKKGRTAEVKRYIQMAPYGIAHMAYSGVPLLSTAFAESEAMASLVFSSRNPPIGHDESWHDFWYGQHALFACVIAERLDLIAVLVAEGADPHRPNKWRTQPIEVAHDYGKTDIMAYFRGLQ